MDANINRRAVAYLVLTPGAVVQVPIHGGFANLSGFFRRPAHKVLWVTEPLQSTV